MSLLLLVGNAFGQTGPDSIPDTPANHWVYEYVAHLVHDGLIYEFPTMSSFTGRRTPSPPSRYEFAVAINAVYYRLHQLREDLDVGSSNKPKAWQSWPELEAAVKRFQPTLPQREKEIDYLLTRFQTELQELGVDTKSVPGQVHADIARIITYHGPFTDVPKGHWAADAAQNLRTLGILQGYPDGKFCG